MPIDISMYFEESNHQTNSRCFSRSFCFESGYEILHHVFLSRSWMYFLPWSGCTRLHWRGTAWIVDFPHSSEFNAKRSVTSGRRTNDTQILSPCNIVVVILILQNQSRIEGRLLASISDNTRRGKNMSIPFKIRSSGQYYMTLWSCLYQYS